MAEVLIFPLITEEPKKIFALSRLCVENFDNSGINGEPIFGFTIFDKRLFCLPITETRITIGAHLIGN